jgi:hypothetical protein
MGNGAKAQQKRERNAQESSKPKSQLKTNANAMSVQCKICKQTFLKTVKKPELLLHVEKHSKEFKDCFPDFE